MLRTNVKDVSHFLVPGGADGACLKNATTAKLPTWRLALVL